MTPRLARPIIDAGQWVAAGSVGGALGGAPRRDGSAATACAGEMHGLGELTCSFSTPSLPAVAHHIS